jgi:hypothetical protein
MTLLHKIVKIWILLYEMEYSKSIQTHIYANKVICVKGKSHLK